VREGRKVDIAVVVSVVGRCDGLPRAYSAATRAS
jgi:hypothetical protein